MSDIEDRANMCQHSHDCSHMCPCGVQWSSHEQQKEIATLTQEIADLKAALSQISESCLSFVNTQTIPISATARAALLKALEDK